MTRRFTTVHDRFQIVDVTDDLGELIESVSSRSDAERIARRYMTRNPRCTAIDIFDVMARKTSTNTWRVDRHGHVTALPRT